MFKSFYSSHKINFIYSNSFLFFFKKNNFLTKSNSTLFIVSNSVECYDVVPIDIFKSERVSSTKINYIFMNIYSLSLFKISLDCPLAVTSSFMWPVNSWYERELSEFTNTAFYGCTDSRSLLLPYSYINNNFLLKESGSSVYAVSYDCHFRQINLYNRYVVSL